MLVFIYFVTKIYKYCKINVLLQLYAEMSLSEKRINNLV